MGPCGVAATELPALLVVFRKNDLTLPKVRRQIERFCRDIVEGLIKPWESLEERQRKKETEARRAAEEEEPQRDQERRHKVGAQLGRRAIRLEIIERAENAFIAPIQDRTAFHNAALVLGVAGPAAPYRYPTPIPDSV